MLEAVLAGAELVEAREAPFRSVVHFRAARAREALGICFSAEVRPEAREIRGSPGADECLRDPVLLLELLGSDQRLFFQFIDANFILGLLQRISGRLACALAYPRAR